MQRQQFLPSIQRVGNFCPVGNSIAIDADTVEGGTAVQFPALDSDSTATDVLVYNSGSVDAFVAFGTSTLAVVAPTDGTPANGVCIPSKNSFVLDKGNNTWVSVITATGTATVYLTQGTGS